MLDIFKTNHFCAHVILARYFVFRSTTRNLLGAIWVIVLINLTHNIQEFAYFLLLALACNYRRTRVKWVCVLLYTERKSATYCIAHVLEFSQGEYVLILLYLFEYLLRIHWRECYKICWGMLPL